MGLSHGWGAGQTGWTGAVVSTLSTLSPATRQYALGWESDAAAASPCLPLVSQVRKPGSPSWRFGGRPRLSSVSSGLLYQVPIFMIARASSAVATLRP